MTTRPLLPPPLLTIREAADLFRVPLSTMRDWVRAGRIVGERIDGTWMLRRDTLRAHLCYRPPMRWDTHQPRPHGHHHERE